MFPTNERAPILSAAALGLLGVGGWLALSAQGLSTSWWAGPDAPGRWLLVSGLLAALVAAVAGTVTRPWVHRLLMAAAVGAALLSIGTIADASKHGDVFGTDVWWLDDDMMITLRYAQQIAAGHGPVWNPGEWVEGITNLLWAFMLAPLHLVLEQDRVAWGAIALGGLLFALLIRALWGVVQRLGGGRESATFAACAMATTLPALHWTAGGGEATLVSLLTVLAVACLVDLRSDRPVQPRRLILAGLLGGLTFAARPDAALAASVWLGVHILLGPRPANADGPGRLQSLAFCAGAVALVPLSLTGLRLLLYGVPVPNTWYLKGTGWDDRWTQGWAYIQPMLVDHAPFLATAAVGVLLAPRRVLPPVLAVVAHLAYIVHVGGDELPERRFLVPILPVLFTASFLGVDALARRCFAGQERVVKRRTLAAFAGGVVLMVGGMSHGLLPGSVPARRVAGPSPEAPPRDMWGERHRSERANVMIGKLVEANTEPDAQVAHFWAGAAAYFSNRPALDLYGKCDAHVARQDAQPGTNKPGHNKWDFDHSLGQAPDVVIGGIGGAASLGRIQATLRGGYRAHAEILRHPEFVRHYARELVLLRRIDPEWPNEQAVSAGWHGVYVRRGSANAPPPNLWRIPSR